MVLGELLPGTLAPQVRDSGAPPWCLEQRAGPRGLAADLVGTDLPGSLGLGRGTRAYHLPSWAGACPVRPTAFGRAC